jgi:predicted nucleic acid-binding protein
MLFLDTSALVKRYVDEEGTQLVIQLMDRDPEWVVSAVARTEAEIALCRLGFDRDDGDPVWRGLAEDLARCYVVPVDPACLERAGQVGCQYEIRTLDALHLAAADRLPRPLVVLTFDRRQADAARAMDLVVQGA